MKRTTIMLPPDLKAQVERRARAEGRSLGEIVRESLGRYVQSVAQGSDDPLLTDDAVFAGEAPRDLASAHDRHLYDDER